MFNLILLPDIQALFMTLLVQVARHKMEAFMAGFQDLIFFFFFFKAGWEIRLRAAVCSISIHSANDACSASFPSTKHNLLCHTHIIFYNVVVETSQKNGGWGFFCHPPFSFSIATIPVSVTVTILSTSWTISVPVSMTVPVPVSVIIHILPWTIPVSVSVPTRTDVTTLLLAHVHSGIGITWHLHTVNSTFFFFSLF